MRKTILAFCLLVLRFFCYSQAQDFSIEKEMEKKEYLIEIVSQDGSIHIFKVLYSGSIAIDARFEGKEVSLTNPIDTRKLQITGKPKISRFVSVVDTTKFPEYGNGDAQAIAFWAATAGEVPCISMEEYSIVIPLMSKESYNFSILKNDDRKEDIKAEIRNFEAMAGPIFKDKVQEDFTSFINEMEQQYDVKSIFGIDKNGERYELQ